MHPIDSLALPLAAATAAAGITVAGVVAVVRRRVDRRAWRRLATVDGRAALYSAAAARGR